MDGATDEVWHFTRGRANELAAAYFGCSANGSSWPGLPLMGLPEVGRASHWETRIMRDDVMAYGFQVRPHRALLWWRDGVVAWWRVRPCMRHCMMLES